MKSEGFQDRWHKSRGCTAVAKMRQIEVSGEARVIKIKKRGECCVCVTILSFDNVPSVNVARVGKVVCDKVVSDNAV